MHPIFKLLAQGARWATATPAHRQLTTRAGYALSRWYGNLAPREQERVRSILKMAATKLARLAIGDVVHWAGLEAVRHGLDERAVSITEIGVKRIAEVGFDRAIEELEAS